MEVLIGLVVGFAIGSSGVGGGTLTAPALMILLNISPRTAVATALCFSALVKINAGISYLWRRQVNFKVLAWMLGGGIPGALVGALCLGRYHQGNQGWVLIIVGAIVAVCATLNLALTLGGSGSFGFHPKTLAILSLPIGLEVSFSSVGAGALGCVLLFSLTALQPAMVVGTDLLFGLALSSISGGIQAVSGNCDWSLLLKMVPAGIAGSLIATRYTHRFPKRPFRLTVLTLAGLLGLVVVNKGRQELQLASLPMAQTAGIARPSKVLAEQHPAPPHIDAAKTRNGN